MKKILGGIYYPAAELAADEKGRVWFYDNMRFLLIFFVVMRHFLFRVTGDFTEIRGLYMIFLLFLMTMFVFVTGFYSKSVIAKDGSFRVGRVVLFFALFFFLDWLIWFTNKVIVPVLRAFLEQGELPDLTQVAAWYPWYMTGAAWYMWACAVWFLLIPLFRKMGFRVSLIVSVAIGCASGYFGFMDSFLCLNKLTSFMPFFVAGYFMNRTQIEAFLSRPTVWRVAAWAFLIAVSVLFVVFHEQVIFYIKRLLEAKDPYEIMFKNRWPAEFGGLWRLLWYCAVFVVSACFFLVVPRCRTFYTVFGARTLQIYIWHCVIVRVLRVTPFYDWLSALPRVPGEIMMALCAFGLACLLAWKPLGVPFDKLTALTAKVPDVRALRSGERP